MNTAWLDYATDGVIVIDTFRRPPSSGPNNHIVLAQIGGGPDLWQDHPPVSVQGVEAHILGL